MRQNEQNQKDKLVHDIYGVIGGPLGIAGGTEVNLSKGSGNNELKEFLTESHQTMKNSKNGTNSMGSKSNSLHLKRSNSSSGMIINRAETFDSYGNLQDQSLDSRQHQKMNESTANMI